MRDSSCRAHAFGTLTRVRKSSNDTKLLAEAGGTKGAYFATWLVVAGSHQTGHELLKASRIINYFSQLNREKDGRNN